MKQRNCTLKNKAKTHERKDMDIKEQGQETFSERIDTKGDLHEQVRTG